VGGLRRNLYKPGRRGWQRWAGTTGLDRFVVNSTRGRSDLERWGVAHERIDVVSNAVELPAAAMDPGERALLRRAWGVAGDDEVVIANVSNLIAVKNHELLLEATARLLERGRRVRTVIYGDGPLREDLRRRSDDPALRGRVVWMGRDACAPARIAAADVFCFTSRSEGCPNVLLEAGAVGLAAVTTDVGGARDVVRDGETGCVVPSDDAQALVAALDRLVADPALRARMGVASRTRVVHEFTPQRTASALQAVYERVLGAAASSNGRLAPREASS
jgi:glycosyltransferase involved in cell wall biosynthesis